MNDTQQLVTILLIIAVGIGLCWSKTARIMLVNFLAAVCLVATCIGVPLCIIVLLVLFFGPHH